MAVDSTHPKYAGRLEDWTQARDAFEGERVVKEKSFEYLPPTISMQIDGLACCTVPVPGGVIPEASEGWVAYWMYRHRARFPDAFNTCIRHNLGLLWQHPPTIKLPESMEYLRDTSTKDRKQTLDQVLREMHKQTMQVGHVALLADMDTETRASDPFYVCVYKAEDKINWNCDADTKKLNFVAFREVYDQLDDNFDRKTTERFRVFQLVGGAVKATVYERPTATSADAVSTTIIGSQIASPASTSAGGAATILPVRSGIMDFRATLLDEIPVVCTSASGLGVDPDVPPLQGLVRLCFAYYRNSADYEQNLFASAQDTFVVEGDQPQNDVTPGNKKKRRIGAGSLVNVQMGGKAYFAGVSGVGLPEQRKALEALTAQAEAASGSLTNAGAGTRESGEALATKVGAKTATLHEIATNCAEALQTLLRMIARWMGLDPLEVEVIPNKDFTDAQVDAGVVLALWQMRKEGGPVALEDIHNYLTERGFTDTAFDQILSALENDKQIIEDAAVTPVEKPIAAGTAAGGAARGVGANTRSRGAKPKKGAPST